MKPMWEGRRNRGFLKMLSLSDWLPFTKIRYKKKRKSERKETMKDFNKLRIIYYLSKWKVIFKSRTYNRKFITWLLQYGNCHMYMTDNKINLNIIPKHLFNTLGSGETLGSEKTYWLIILFLAANKVNIKNKRKQSFFFAKIISTEISNQRRSQLLSTNCCLVFPFFTKELKVLYRWRHRFFPMLSWKCFKSGI